MIQTDTSEPLAYSVVEAAQKLSISRSALYQAIKDGKLPVAKFGTRTVVPRDELLNFMKAHLVVR
jgi:excisionase family DNA binding protein